MVYLDLLRQVAVWGYCLRSNHVHVVAIPRRPEALAEAFHRVQGRYAACWNVAHTGSGHVW
jgi:putative transposase